MLLAAGCAAQAPVQTATDPRRPAAIETTNVPPVPAETWERLRPYQNVRSASFLDWAPDGKSILISTRFGATSQLHLLCEPGGRREQITFFDEPVADGRFLADGSILFAMGRGGDENWQLWRLDRASGRAALLTDGQSRHSLMAMDRARRRVVVGISKPGARDTDLYVLDPLTGKSELLHAARGQDWWAPEWSPDGSKICLERNVSANESYLHVLDVASRALTPIPIPGGGKAAHGSVAFLDEGTLYVTSNAAGEFMDLAAINLGTMKYSWLNVDRTKCDAESLETGRLPDERFACAYTLNADGASRLMLHLGGIEQEISQELPLPLGVVTGMRFSPGAERLAFTLHRPDAPGDVYTVDLEGKLTRWTTSEVGGLNPAAFVTPERESVASFDGTRVPFTLYRPRGAKKAPVIIDIHGGPEGQARPFFSGTAQFYVNELGCAVIFPNVRGSSGYGKTYLAADNAEKREDSVRDIGAILDWIAQQPDLDASRVAVTGGSYGGYMVLACLVHYGDRLRAGVDFVGIANFSTFLKTTSAYRRDLRRAEYGDERDPRMRAVFERISPSNNAERIRSALLVAHGRNDARVPFGEAELIAARARGPVWTVYAANEGHGFGRKENRDYLSGVIAEFLAEFLLK